MKIGLLGPYGFGNLGDAAIQQAMIEHITTFDPEAEIVGFCLNPQDTEDRFGIPAYPIAYLPGGQPAGRLKTTPQSIRFIKGFRVAYRVADRVSGEIRIASQAYRSLAGVRLLIISGGGQLDDYWRGPWGHPFTLLKWSILARLRGAKLAIVSVGAGPIDSSLSRIFLRMVLHMAAYRSYRDQDSKQFLDKIGFKNDDPVFPDLAFSVNLPQPAPDKQKTRKLTIGISPMAYFDPRVWPEKDQAIYSLYLQRLAAFIEWLAGRGHQILFFCGHIIQDRRAVKDLKAVLKRLGLEEDGQIIDPPIQSVDDLLSAIARTDITVSSRFHSVLLSLAMHRPVIALSYHRKIEALMDDLGLAGYCMPIGEFDVETLKEAFLRLEADREPVSETIQTQTEKYRARLDRQYETLFGNNAAMATQITESNR